MHNYSYVWKSLALVVGLAVIVGPRGGALAVKDAGAGEYEADYVFDGDPFSCRILSNIGCGLHSSLNFDGDRPALARTGENQRTHQKCAFWD